MAPQPRVDVPSGIYEAMLRGNSGQDIFFEPEDWGELYHLLAEGKVRFEYRLHAYCLMSNPVHLAVVAPTRLHFTGMFGKHYSSGEAVNSVG